MQERDSTCAMSDLGQNQSFHLAIGVNQTVESRSVDKIQSRNKIITNPLLFNK